MGFDQYQLAQQFLERAAAANPAANVDLAIALSITAGPMKALEALDRVPGGDRSGDYLLMKARLLDLAGQPAESDKVLDEGMRLAISRPRVCRDAALMLVRRNRMQAALDLLNRADGTDPELWLTKAVLLGLMNQSPAAEKTLKTIQSQWPEWDRPYRSTACCWSDSTRRGGTKTPHGRGFRPGRPGHALRPRAPGGPAPGRSAVLLRGRPIRVAIPSMFAPLTAGFTRITRSNLADPAC
jgi:hypothetical protein